MLLHMERIAHRAKSHEEAAAWDRRQQRAMTPDERFKAAAILRRRVYGDQHPDIRECHRVK